MASAPEQRTAMTSALSRTFDSTRDEIFAAMEQRIEKGDRTKLTRLSGVENSWQSQHENVTTLANSMRQSKASRLHSEA